MGVTLRYCDHCGNKMGPDQLESDQVLAIKDKIFCPACRPKVIAALEKRKQAAAAQAAGGATPRAVKPAAAQAPGRAPGRKAPTPRAKAGAAGGKAPAAKAPRGRAPQPGARKPAPPASPPPAAPKGKPAAAKPAGRRPAKGGAAASPQRASAQKHKRGAPTGRRPAPPPEVEEAAVGEFEVKKRSNPAALVGIVVVIAAGVIGLLYSVGGVGGKPDEQPKKTVAKVDPKELAKKENEKRAKDLFDQATEVFTKNPEHYEIAISNFEQIASHYSGTQAGQEAAARLIQLQDEWRTKVAATWSQIESDFKRLTEEEKFSEAYAVVKKLPPILEGTLMQEKFELLQADGKIQGEAMERLEELKIKAYERLTKNEEDIALHILAEFRDKYQDEAPEVWDLKERTIVRIKKEGTKVFVAEMEKAAKELAEREAAAKEAEIAARKKAWSEKLQSSSWSKHINPRSDYNWVVDSDKRRFGQEPKWKFRGGVMKADNDTGSEMFKAVFNNFWQDYALRFDVRLVKGSLKVSPRTQASAGRFVNVKSQTNPMVELTEKDFGRDWITVTMYVQGDTVQLFKNEMDPLMDKTYDGIQDRLPSSGGFLFWVDDGCNIEIRNVETKLISHTRKQLFSA